MRLFASIGFIVLLLFTGSCNAQRVKARAKPEWVQSRPIQSAYYVGIGIASKNASPTEFQQVAKKNALNDLISEIKVTVTANSALSQFQVNQEFRQQFESQTRISALQTIEDFELVDSWEDQETYWVFYRLSREQYLAAKRRKMQLAVDRAEDLYQRAQQADLRQSFMQAFQFKILALKEIQEYLDADLQTVVNGKQVYLVNEMLSSIQNQMNAIDLVRPAADSVKQLRSVTIHINLKSGNSPLTGIPLGLSDKSTPGKTRYSFVSDQQGKLIMDAAQLRTKGTYVILRFDSEKAMARDSLNLVLKQLLQYINWPSLVINLSNNPLKLYLSCKELNISKPTTGNTLEPIIKRLFIDDGCVFVKTPGEADYSIVLTSDTRNLGMIYKNTLGASLDLTLSITDNAASNEVYKDALQNIKGYQSTAETAGLEAYKKAGNILIDTFYPRIRSEFLGR
ncbi:MAG: LPP20 family lipoprotein [Bacteroidia bacterium]